MAWIEEVERERARGKLEEIYGRAAAAGTGEVGPMVRAWSLNPDALEARGGLFRALMFGKVSSLTRAEREMVAVVTSVANRCGY